MWTSHVINATDFNSTQACHRPEKLKLLHTPHTRKKSCN